ncbi:hypothetical protein OIV83_002385 [Microbotryomycetes sp. JL201]|nr:hypothetical protein OIV83_002385 [Microbotryomycetes sp. JL201]
MGRPSPAYYDNLLLEKCKMMIHTAMSKPHPSGRRHMPWQPASQRRTMSYERFVEALDPEWSINVAAFEAIVRETTERLHPTRRGYPATMTGARTTRQLTSERSARTGAAPESAPRVGQRSWTSTDGDMPDTIDMIRHSRRLQMMRDATDDEFVPARPLAASPRHFDDIEVFFPSLTTEDETEPEEDSAPQAAPVQGSRSPTPLDELVGIDLEPLNAPTALLSSGDRRTRLLDLCSVVGIWADLYGVDELSTIPSDTLPSLQACLNSRGLFPQRFSRQDLEAVSLLLDHPDADDARFSFATDHGSRPIQRRSIEAGIAALQEMLEHANRESVRTNRALEDHDMLERLDFILGGHAVDRTSRRVATRSQPGDSPQPLERRVRQRISGSERSSTARDQSVASTGLSTTMSGTPASSLARSPTHSGPFEPDGHECHSPPVAPRLTSAAIAEAAALSRRRIAPLRSLTRAATHLRRAQ